MYVLAPNQTIQKYPYSVQELRLDNSNTSFCADIPDTELASWGVYPVKPTAYPTVDYTKNITDGTPVFQNGEWVQVWTISDATASEIEFRTQVKSNDVRADRNQRLAVTDWTQLADAPVNSAAWGTYRQALRDVTKQAGFPWEVQWPTKPE